VTWHVATCRPSNSRICETPKNGMSTQGRVGQSTLMLQKSKTGSKLPVGVPARKLRCLSQRGFLEIINAMRA
jgi:hypothetical protein